MPSDKPQTAKDKNWLDAKGTSVPYSRTSAFERMCEREAHRLAKRARAIEQELSEYKDDVRNTHAQVFAAFLKSKGLEPAKAGKGNNIWHNFDRSIKVEVDQQERITFDDMLISSARDLFTQFIKEAVKSEVEFVAELIDDAFKTRNGRLDPKRVMSLIGFKHKVKHHTFQQAIGMMEESIRREHSKTYYTISTRQADGSYASIKLDFSSI